MVVAFVHAHANQLEDVALPIFLFISVVLPRARLISLLLRATDVPDMAVEDVLSKLSALQQPTALALKVSSSFPVIASLLATHSVLTKLRVMAANCGHDTRSAFALCTRLTSLTQLDMIRITDLGVASQLQEAARVPLDWLSRFPSLRTATVSINPREHTAKTPFPQTLLTSATLSLQLRHGSFLLRFIEHSPHLRYLHLEIKDTTPNEPSLHRLLDDIYALHQLDSVTLEFIAMPMCLPDLRQRFPWLQIVDTFGRRGWLDAWDPGAVMWSTDQETPATTP